MASDVSKDRLARISVLAALPEHTSIGRTSFQNPIWPIAANLQFFRFNKTNGTLTATLLPAINDPGRVKFNLNTTYYIKLRGNLSWNVSFYGNWDTQPPNGLPGSDYGSSSGLSWTFGLK